jgi:hypothetical protein
VGDERKGDGDGMMRRAGLEGLPSDHDPDKDQDGRDGCDGDEAVKEIHQSKDGDGKEDEADEERITATRTEAFVSGMADIDGCGECATKESACDRTDAIHKLAGANGVMIARSFGAFDVIHGFDKIVDLDRKDSE